MKHLFYFFLKCHILGQISEPVGQVSCLAVVVVTLLANPGKFNFVLICSKGNAGNRLSYSAG
jgi:hypothetical protein